MRSVCRSAERSLARVVQISSWAAGLVVVAIALIIVVDVVMRAFLHMGSGAAYELASYGLVAVTFGGLAITQREGKHIEVEAVTDHLPSSVRTWHGVAAGLIAIFFYGWLAWASAEVVLEKYSGGAVSITALAVPMWIPTSLVPAGLALLVLQLVHDITKSVRS